MMIYGPARITSDVYPTPLSERSLLLGIGTWDEGKAIRAVDWHLSSYIWLIDTLISHQEPLRLSLMHAYLTEGSHRIMMVS